MKKRLKPLIPFAILSIAAVIELVLSNFVYFAFVAGKNHVNDYSPDLQTVTASGDDTQFSFGISAFQLNSVAFTVKAADENCEPFEINVSVYADDASVTNSFNLLASKKVAVSASEKTTTFYCNSSGVASAILFDIDGAESDVEITNVTLNPQYKISFNSLRFCALLLIGQLIFLLKNRKDENKLVSYENRHKRSMAVSVALSVAGSLFVAVMSATGEGIKPIAYPLADPLTSYDPYIQQFDAFMKGQLHLDIKPDEALLNLKNPYDPTAREGIYYLWDRAFFDGKYYSYFGVTPLLLVYFPFWFITGMLPHYGFVMAVFLLITAVFFALAVEEYAEFSGKKHFAYFTSFCAVSAFLASFALLIARGQQRFYYLAGMAGMAFSAAFIFFMLKAVNAKSNARRIIFFALAGISFGLGFHSRVNSVLPLAIISAVFVILWAIKRIKEKQIRSLICEFAALGTPVAIALAASMAYNKARFGGFFDFGTAYQLTVADTSFYSVGAHGLIPSFFHYFLQGFKFRSEFPFIGFDYIASSDYGRYVYVDSGLGIMAMPFMLLLLLSPVVFKKKTIGKNQKIIFAVALTSLPVTAFLNFCLGGVIFRYTADISLIAAFLAAVIALETAESALTKFGKDGYGICKKAFYALGAANAATALGAVLLQNGNVVSANPVVFEYVKNIFVFWN